MGRGIPNRQHLARRIGAAASAFAVALSGLVALVGFQIVGTAPAGATGSLTPTISNLPASATPGGSFTPVVSTSSSGATSVTSATPSVCAVNQDGSVSYLSAGTCSLNSHVAASQAIIGSTIRHPGEVTVDASGNVYVSDITDGQVREIYPNGTDTTIAYGFSTPYGVAVDTSGNVYASDPGNNQVAEVSPDGTQTTIGSGFNVPLAVAVDVSGNVYVSDT